MWCEPIVEEALHNEDISLVEVLGPVGQLRRQPAARRHHREPAGRAQEPGQSITFNNFYNRELDDPASLDDYTITPELRSRSRPIIGPGRRFLFLCDNRRQAA